MPGPLAGVRVLELPAIGPVPFLGMLLADLGAEVIRIDRLAGEADPLAALPVGGSGPLGRGRRSIALDLRQAEGAAIALDLVADCDALIEGFRPGVAERLGIGPETALNRNPKLVYGRMTGWGQDGPLAARAGHDITYLAVSGLLHGIGPAAGPPTPPANYLGDFGGGAMSLAVGLLAAVLSARSTGQGQVVDAAMVDGAPYLATMVRTLHGHGLWRDEREANLFDGGSPQYRCYRCADGRFVAVGALEPKFWNILLDTLGLDPASTPSPFDPANHAELSGTLGEIFATRSRDEWAAIFEPLDACVAPVLSLAEAPDHPHNVARASYAESAGVIVSGPTPRFEGTPASLAAAPPAVGADTEQLLTELGYPEQQRRQLRDRGIVG
ncbi:MAG: CoA transferase [Actinomycetota bacterium]|nr:CoA transferase [Actinomycetota bacterium]MDQ2956488.1 CoA transferase [Actinomycetota bacterium]